MVNKSVISMSEIWQSYCRIFNLKVQECYARDSFHCFENLLKREYCFQCTICKEAPEVLIFDGNAKIRNNLDFTNCFDKSVEGFDGTVDPADFWVKNSENILMRMFDNYREPNLNFKISPIMDPEIAAAKVINTEFVKLNTIRDLAQSGHKNIPTDEIRNLCARNLKKLDLQEACKNYAIPFLDSWSISDLRDALIQHFENNVIEGIESSGLDHEMRKLFPSYRGTNGGLLFGLCEHGIIYYCKYLVRGEGSRDILDAILSFKFKPKYLIYDDAGTLAVHISKRLGQVACEGMIGPHGGRVMPVSGQSIEFAKKCLDEGKSVISEAPQGQMLVLYDRFHQENSKKTCAILRRLDLVSRARKINSQQAEQLNRQVKPLVRIFNVLSPRTTMNCLRRFLSERNAAKNEARDRQIARQAVYQKAAAIDFLMDDANN